MLIMCCEKKEKRENRIKINRLMCIIMKTEAYFYKED